MVDRHFLVPGTWHLPPLAVGRHAVVVGLHFIPQDVDGDEADLRGKVRVKYCIGYI